MPYGNQALFLKAETFRAIGGFPDLQIMDDYELVRRLCALGRIAILPYPANTSARLASTRPLADHMDQPAGYWRLLPWDASRASGLMVRGEPPEIRAPSRISLP